MKYTLIFFLIINSLFAFAVDFEYQFTNFGVNDGLPSAQVYEIVQDQKGYIWFGTDRGLVRFNGYNFKVYTVKNGLSTNVIFKLDIDAQGRLCCYGKDRKIHILNGERFVEFKYNSAFKDLHSPKSNLVKFDFNEEGFFYCLSDVSEGKAALGSLKFNGEVELNRTNGIHIDTTGNGRIGLLDPFIQIDTNGNQFVGELNPLINSLIFVNDSLINSTLFKSRDVPIKSEGSFADIARYKDKVYFSICNNLYKFDLQRAVPIKKIHQFSNDILDLKFDRQGNLFVGTRQKGLWKIDGGNAASLTCVLPDISVSNILIDAQNGVWVASLYNGLFYCGHQEGRKLVIEGEDEITLLTTIGEDIFAVTKSNQLLRMSFAEGEIVSDRSYNLIERNVLIKLNELSVPYNSYLLPIGVFIDSLSNHYVSFQFVIRDFFSKDEFFYTIGRTTVIVFGGNLIHLHTANYQYETTLSCGMVNKDGQLILGTEEGVQFHAQRDNLINVNSTEQVNYTIDQMQPYHPEIPFFRSNMRDMINYNDSMLIFGSAEQGLYIERNGKPDIWLRESDGIVSDAIDHIYADDERIIVMTKAGVSHISAAGKIKNYTIKNGLLSNNATDVLIRKDELWVATDKGTSVFDLKVSNAINIPIYLSDLKIDGVPEKLKAHYELDHTKSFLDVSFEGLSYAQKGEINYRYQLKGVDDSWVSTTSTMVRYVNLPYGRFEFWIRAQKGDQMWTEPIQLFTLEKIKPFWETNVFYFIDILFTLGLIWFVFNIRYQRLKRRQEDKNVMLNMERKTLQAQMHPHFVFNSLTSLQSLIVDDRKIESQEFLAKFAKLTRLALNHSTKNTITLKEEIEILTHYIDLEQVRYANKFEYSITSELDEFEIEIPPMLIQPFVENAIKHGLSNKENGGKLHISFKKRDQFTFLCLVEDNGAGRSLKGNSFNRKSLGIKLVSERLEIILHQLKEKESAIQIEDLVEDDKPKGTRVKIILPLKNRDK